MAVDCSRLMATVSAPRMLVAVSAMVRAAETRLSAGTAILNLAKTFFNVAIIATSSAATAPKAVSVGYLAKMF
jgi:hypothetical protein